MAVSKNNTSGNDPARMKPALHLGLCAGSMPAFVPRFGSQPIMVDSR